MYYLLTITKKNWTETNTTVANATQVYKVREFIRKSKYLNQSKEYKAHFSFEGKKALARDLVHFTILAETNIKRYLNERTLKKDITIKPVYATHEEVEQETSLLNVTTNELKVKIF